MKVIKTLAAHNAIGCELFGAKKVSTAGHKVDWIAAQRTHRALLAPKVPTLGGGEVITIIIVA